MSQQHRHLLSLRNGGATQDLDVLLRDFFRTEMPHPWPALKAPRTDAAPPRPARSRWSPVRSRLALAASVGALMVGSWCLTDKLPDYAPVSVEAAPTGGGSASGVRLFKKAVPAAATRESRPAGEQPGTPAK